MGDSYSHVRGYAIVALLGAIGGGITFAFATRAIPKMMSRMMCGMISNMMAQMGDGSTTPEEM